MSLICVVGDLHGNTLRAKKAIQFAAEKGCSAVIQLGDFGLWPGPKGKRYLETVFDTTAECKMRFLWIAGNHENWDEIDKWKAEWTWPLTHEHPHVMSEYVSYVPDGARFRLDGIRYGALGGAYSVDKSLRTPFISWWPQEEPTMEDVDRLGEAPLDVLLTHDAPAKPEGGGMILTDRREREAGNARHLIRLALENTCPRTLFHGHWHYRYDTHWNGTTVYGIASDQEPFYENVVLFDAKRHRIVAP